MEHSINIEELKELLDQSEGYVLTVTVLDKGQLHHHLHLNTFPMEDLEQSMNEIKKLADKKIEENNKIVESNKKVEDADVKDTK